MPTKCRSKSAIRQEVVECAINFLDSRLNFEQNNLLTNIKQLMNASTITAFIASGKLHSNHGLISNLRPLRGKLADTDIEHNNKPIRASCNFVSFLCCLGSNLVAQLFPNEVGSFTDDVCECWDALSAVRTLPGDEGCSLTNRLRQMLPHSKGY